MHAVKCMFAVCAAITYLLWASEGIYMYILAPLMDNFVNVKAETIMLALSSSSLNVST